MSYSLAHTILDSNAVFFSLIDAENQIDYEEANCECSSLAFAFKRYIYIYMPICVFDEGLLLKDEPKLCITKCTSFEFDFNQMHKRQFGGGLKCSFFARFFETWDLVILNAV